MLKFFIEEVHAQSGGRGTSGVSKSGKGLGRKSNIGGSSNSTRTEKTKAKSGGLKRKGLTKGTRPSNVRI